MPWIQHDTEKKNHHWLLLADAKELTHYAKHWERGHILDFCPLFPRLG